MTAISLLSGDFSLEMPDEFVAGGTNRVGTFMITRGAAPSSTVYTSNALYSAIAEVTDDFIAMGFKNPILPVTPNEYTLENKAYITREATEFLKEGTITGNWTLGTLDGEGVIAKAYTIGLGADFIAGDIGREVVETTSGHQGTLLDFEVMPDGTLLAWIRPSDPAVDTFALTTALTATGGTGNPDTTVAATNGNISYNAVQAIGSVPTATEVYLIQDRIKLTDQAGAFQWWATDPLLNLGIISVLVRTTDPATAAWPQIKDADLEVFARRYGALYDNFRLNVGGGGFQALPLASSPDINNTTGYRRVTETGATGTGPFVVGEVANEAVSGASVVITAVGGTTVTPVLQYYLVGDPTIDLFDSGAQTLTAPVSGATMTTAAPVANLLGPTDSTSGEGGTVTFTLGEKVDLDHDGDGNVESYSVTVDAISNVDIGKVYERLKYECRRGAITDLFTGQNVAGEMYRGLEGTFEYDAKTAGVMGVGDDMLISARTGFSARLMAQIDPALTGEVTHITLTDIQSSLVANQPANNDIVADEGSETVTLASDGSYGFETYTSPKSSPFGTFTGSQIFGARGVAFINPASTDTQAYLLTDNQGNLRTPPNTVSFLVENTRAGDRILVARDTGVAGIIDKDQFGGMTAVAVSSKTITVAGTIDAEVGTAAVVRVVENALQQEHHYVYDSVVTGVSGVFTLRDITAASADAGTSDTVLDKTGGPSFVTENVDVGMLIFVTARSSTYEVTGSITADTLAINLLYGAGGFVSGDAFTINETIQLYAVSDDIYDLLLDIEETTGTDGTPGSETNSFVQSTTFNVVVNVRQGKLILPFSQNTGVNASGGGVTVVRSPDTIAV